MNRNVVAALGASLLSLGVGCVATDDVGSIESESQAADPSVIDQWNAIADNAIVTVGRPTRAEYHFAVVHAAIFDAVNAIDKSYTPILIAPGDVSSSASQSAAVAAAARDMLAGLFPAQTADLDAKYAASLATIPNGSAKTKGIAVGQEVAAAHLARFATAGFGVDRPEYYVADPAGPGVWVPTVAGRGVAPWVGHVLPFSAASADVFNTAPFDMPGPPALGSAEWTTDFNEVKAYGRLDSAVRTAEQTNLGFFWAENTPRIWNRALVGIAQAQGLDQTSKARLYAQFHVAGADATIACWLKKYDVQFWRPQTAITTAFDDGNADTATDTTWRPLAATPNHPEYPSGHTAYTGAVERVLQDFFGTDAVPFTVVSNGANVTNRTLNYGSFTEATAAVIDSRIWLGFHYRGTDEDGAVLGRNVAQNMNATLFQVKDRPED